MDKKIPALTFCIVLLIPQGSLGQHAGTLSLKPETKTVLLEAPKPKATHAVRNVFISNAVMFGASVVEANAVAFGSAQCYAEALRTFDPNGQNHLRYFGHGGSGGQFHPYQHAFKLTIPIDVGVVAISYVMHKKHHDTLALLFPVASASAQMSSAGLKYGAGCF
jgi:hypothetical protein